MSKKEFICFSSDHNLKNKFFKSSGIRYESNCDFGRENFYFDNYINNRINEEKIEDLRDRIKKLEWKKIAENWEEELKNWFVRHYHKGDFTLNPHSDPS